LSRCPTQANRRLEWTTRQSTDIALNDFTTIRNLRT
jgi:hypothetical protein